MLAICNWFLADSLECLKCLVDALLTSNKKVGSFLLSYVESRTLLIAAKMHSALIVIHTTSWIEYIFISFSCAVHKKSTTTCHSPTVS